MLGKLGESSLMHFSFLWKCAGCVLLGREINNIDIPVLHLMCKKWKGCKIWLHRSPKPIVLPNIVRHWLGAKCIASHFCTTSNHRLDIHDHTLISVQRRGAQYTKTTPYDCTIYIHNLYYIKDQGGIHSCERRKKQNKDFMWERIRNKIMQSAIVYKHSVCLDDKNAVCAIDGLLKHYYLFYLVTAYAC